MSVVRCRDDAYGDKAADASNQCCCKFREELNRKPCTHQQRVIQLQCQTEVTRFLENTFQV